jgi:hypothetical protein
MTEQEPKNSIEQKEPLTPKPNLLDVVMIDGKLCQVAPDCDSFIILAEKATTGKSKSYYIDWDKYECEVIDGRVKDLKENNVISDEEYEAVYWGSEQKNTHTLKGWLHFLVNIKVKNKRIH